MSSIHEKQSSPMKRSPRYDKDGNKLSRVRSETSKAIRRFKRAHKKQHSDIPFKQYMTSFPEGKAWLKRKKEMR